MRVAVQRIAYYVWSPGIYPILVRIADFRLCLGAHCCPVGSFGHGVGLLVVAVYNVVSMSLTQGYKIGGLFTIVDLCLIGTTVLKSTAERAFRG